MHSGRSLALLWVRADQRWKKRLSLDFRREGLGSRSSRWKGLTFVNLKQVIMASLCSEYTVASRQVERGSTVRGNLLLRY